MTKKFPKFGKQKVPTVSNKSSQKVTLEYYKMLRMKKFPKFNVKLFTKVDKEKVPKLLNETVSKARNKKFIKVEN